MNNHLGSIVLLRAVACLLVVFTHSVIYVKSLPGFYDGFEFSYFMTFFGAVGVDLFFVLSGFILLYAGDTKPKKLAQFFWGRFLRIYPPYFFVFLFSVVLGFLRFGFDYRFFDDLFVIIKSLFLMSTITSDGHVANPVGVSWTLSYELYFYVVLGLAWKVETKLKPIAVGLFFLAVIFLEESFFKGSVFFGNSIVLEFVLGMLVYVVWRFYLLLWPSVFVLIIFLISWCLGLFLFNWVGFEDKLIPWRWFFLGVPSAVCLMFFLKANLVSDGSFFLKIGNASYSIYLTHFVFSLPVVGYFTKVFLFSYLKIRPDVFCFSVVFLLCFCFSIVVGFYYYGCVESRLSNKSISDFFNRKFDYVFK